MRFSLVFMFAKILKLSAFKDKVTNQAVVMVREEILLEYVQL